MNLLEYSFSSASNRANRSIDELLFEHEAREAETGQSVVRRVSMSFSSKYGRPTIEDDQVYVGFQALTYDRRRQGCDSARLEFTRYEILKAIGWRDTGPNYAKIDRAINRIGGVWVVAENAFYDRVAASWVDKKFHIIDESHLFSREKYDLARGANGTLRGPRSWIRWGAPFYQSFAEGYLATFDLDEYRAVKGGIAKKLFRYANKRLWKRHRFVIGLRSLAEEKLGFKPEQFEAELARSLAVPFTELKRFGIDCTIKQQGRSKQVQITKKERRKRVQNPSSPVPGLAKQLLARGVDNGVELVQRFDAEKIRDQIENYDDRRRHGNNVGPGWLRCAIEKDYGFRKGFKPSRLVADEKKARAEKRLQALATKNREEAELQAQQAADREAFSKFLKFRDSLGDQRCRELEDEVLSKCSGFVRNFVLKARRNNEVGMFHQLLWEQHIIPTVAKK